MDELDIREVSCRAPRAEQMHKRCQVYQQLIEIKRLGEQPVRQSRYFVGEKIGNRQRGLCMEKGQGEKTDNADKGTKRAGSLEMRVEKGLGVVKKKDVGSESRRAQWRK
jgi:hypothetical protein